MKQPDQVFTKVSICKHCHQRITSWRELWWSADNDFICPGKNTQHAEKKDSNDLHNR